LKFTKKSTIRWSLLFIALIILTAVAFYYQKNFEEKLKQLALKSLQETLEPDLQLEGVNLNLLSATLTLKKVTFPQQNEGQPPLMIQEVKVALSPWSLLTEVLVIRKITLKGPEIVVLRDMDGKVVWPALHLKKKPEPDRKQMVLVRRITIENGRFLFKNPQKNPEMVFPHLEASIAPDLQMKNFEVEFLAKDGQVTYQDLTEKNLQVRGKLKAHPARVDVIRLELSAGDSNLILQGDITRLDSPQPLVNLLADAELSGSLLQKTPWVTSQVLGKARVHAEIRGAYPALHTKGNALLKEVGFKTLNVFTGKVDFSYFDGTLAFQHLQGESLGGSLGGDIVLKVSQKPMSYRLDLKVRDLILERINSLLPSEFATTGMRLSGEIQAFGQGFSRDKLQGSGWLKASRDSSQATSSHPIPSQSAPGKGRLPLPLNKALAPFNQIETRFEAVSGAMLRINSSLTSDLNSIRLNGSVSLDGALDLDVDLTSQDVAETTKSWKTEPLPSKPRFFDLAGPLQFSGRLTGTLASPHLEGRLTAQQALLRGKPIGSVKGDLVMVERKLSFNKTTLTKSTAHYGLTGSLDFQDEQPQFTINATISEGSAGEILSPFLPNFPLQGVVNGNLTAQGKPAEFLLQSNLVLGEGAIYGQHFQKGEIDLEVTRSRVSFTRVHLSKEKSVVEGSGWISFDKQFSAKITSPEMHIEDLDLLKGLAPHIQADLTAEITGSGDFQAPEFRGQAKVKELIVSSQSLGKGQLHMTLVGRNLAFEASVGQAQTSGLLKLEKGLPIKTNISFVDLPLSSFLKPSYPTLLENITLLCSGRMAISGKAQNLSDLQIQGTFTRLSADIGGYKVTNVGDGTLELDNGLLQVKSFRLRGEGTTLSILGEVKLKEHLNLFVNGEADLDIFRLLTHEFSYGRGKAYLVLKITDQWNDPKIQGGLTVQDGTLRSETLSQTITITSMGLFFNQRQILLENLEGEASGGHLKATGKLELKNLVPDNFGLLVDLTDAKANVGEGFSLAFSGSFTFQGDLQSHQLRGEAQIQRVAYTRRVDLKSLVLELQKRDQAPQPTPFLGETKLNVHFSGKDNIWINNNVAKLPLEADLFLKGTFDHPLLFGHVEAREGEVYFRNHVFKVQSGTLDFINPNQIVPILDLRAETTVRNYQVEMSLSGKLDKPLRLELVSDPALSETDILALLTVGKTAEELTAQPGQATGEAISVPTSVLFDEFVEDKVKQLTGIDRFQIDPYAASSKASAGPRLTVQKRLLDDQLTVTYVSAIDPSEEDVIKLEYQVGKNVAIIGERDDNGRLGGDLTLRLEFR
jgi:hypothetical protein